MPNFSKEGKYFFVSYVTGPSHVRLGLALIASTVVEPPLLVVNSRVGDCCHGKIDEVRLKEAVIAGVRAANLTLGTSVQAIEIAYIPNDSPRYELFSHCARLIVEYFQNEFQRGDE
jgi:hypothetical protein